MATVANIDWPTKPALQAANQRAELLAIMDKCAQLNLNTVIFQIRPACDALYKSKLEPWSDFLTGTQGQPPSDDYDPLAFAIEEAHKRGIELHAWFNPFRARHYESKSQPGPTHVSRTKSRICKTYGRYLWLDPGEPDAQKHSLDVVLDVVSRYDLDGVHIDDYFYPYKERDSKNAIIPFPDDPSWAAYQRKGGKLSRDDWRRDNINRFVKEMYDRVKGVKRHVKVGVSPFGIWRPGHPPNVSGFDPYLELYADSKIWLENGWLDYFAPQLYWKIEAPKQAFPELLKWWIEQNRKQRNMVPGLFTSLVEDGTARSYPVEEPLNQIEVSRRTKGSHGVIHFSMKVFLQNRGGISEKIQATSYAQPALNLAYPWLGEKRPGRPYVKLEDRSPLQLRVGGNGGEPFLWAVQAFHRNQQQLFLFPGNQKELVALPTIPASQAAVYAINKAGVESEPVVMAV